MLLALSLLQSLVLRRWAKSEVSGQLVSGGLFGLIAVVAMMTPVQLQPGLIFDPRSVIISLAGFFGGPLVAVISAAIAGSYRLWLGGAGAFTGTLVIVVCAVMGLGYRQINHRYRISTRTWHFLFFGLVVHVAVILCMFTLPADIRWNVIDKITLPFLIVFPPATLFLGLFLLDGERRQQEEKALAESESKLTESNQLLSGVLEHTHMMTVFLDPRFNFIWVNQAYADTCGHAPSFFPGKNHFDLYPHEENQAIFQRVVDTGESFFVAAKPFEFPDQPERGVTYWDWSLAPLKDDKGAVTGLVFTLAEVTERIRAEQAMRQSETDFRTLFEQAGDYILLLEVTKDKDLVIADANQAACEVHGYTREELLGRPIKDLDRSLDKERMRVLLDQVLSGESLLFETAHARKDGTTFPVEVSAKLLAFSGSPTRILSIERDITQRKQAEEALKESEEKYKALYDSAPLSYQSLDDEGRFKDINPTWLNTLGYDRQEVIGKWFGDFLHPHWKGHFEKNFPEFKRLGCVHDVQFKLRHKDGHYLDVSFEGCAGYTSTGRFKQSYCVFQDITQRKQAEEERDRLLRDTGERVKELRCMYALAESIRTRETLEKVFNGAVALIPPAWRYPQITCARLRFDDQEYRSEPFGETPWRQSADIVVDDKRRGTLEVFYLEERPEADEGPFLTEERELLDNMSHTLGEAIEHEQSERDREKAEYQLRQARKMDAIGQLTGGIAHDFNNILGIILGNLDLLEHQIAADDKTLSRVETIKKSAQRAADLTKQLLGFSRRQVEQVVTTDIRHIIRDMDRLIARSLTPEVTVEHQFADDLWLTEIDPGDFQDALLNLVLNARDAMPDGGRLTLEARNSTLDTAYCDQNPGSTPGEYVQLAVSDNGVGISPDKKEKIFEPFFTTKPQGKGTGLGLAMVYGFAKRSDGYVKAYSEQNIGTTIRLYLPRTEGEEHPLEIIAEPSDTLPRGRETILVVDDEEELLELAQESLRALGYRVLSASSGRQAMERLSENPTIDLLFSDVVMPGGMNGYALAERATANRPHLKVLLTSGYTEKAVAHNGQARFTTNLLSKPYSQAELAQRVRALLGQSEAPDQGRSEAEQVPAQPTVAPIEWTDALSTGIEAMDEDHRVLLALLNRSQRAVEVEEAEQSSRTILDELSDYAKIHFRREEAVMAACGYPGLDNHRQVHQLLLKQIKKIQVQLNRGKLNTGELTTFIHSWWHDHVHNMDRAITPYCQGKDDLIEQALEQMDTVSEQDGPT